jgi:hypothetical protein
MQSADPIVEPKKNQTTIIIVVVVVVILCCCCVGVIAGGWAFQDAIRAAINVR